MTTNTTATTSTPAPAALEALLTKWLANNPGGSILRDVEIAEA